MHNLYVEPMKEFCDIIIDNNIITEYIIKRVCVLPDGNGIAIGTYNNNTTGIGPAGSISLTASGNIFTSNTGTLNAIGGYSTFNVNTSTDSTAKLWNYNNVPGDSGSPLLMLQNNEVIRTYPGAILKSYNPQQYATFVYEIEKALSKK